MSTGNDNLSRIESLKRRVARLELWDKSKDVVIGNLQERLKRLEEPIGVVCPQCGGIDIKSGPCGPRTAIISDRPLSHVCMSCTHAWRANIKDRNLPDGIAEKRGMIYRIVYRTDKKAKPTFIHVRADSESRALMAFIDETSPLQVSAVQLDNEYDGPLLNERENFWPASNDAKQMEKAPPPGVYEAVVLIAGEPDRDGHIHSEELLREMAAKEKGYKIRLEYGKVALVAKVTIPEKHPKQETEDAKRK